ncbi:MAG: type IV secretion system protein [Sandarakinorhabdus sp.]|nr:type IV secretion system protein [Sandarakinorhabdus sp.]
MIDACAIAAGPPSLARDVLASTDCFIGVRVEQAYGQLLAPGGGFSTALTIGLTIYVAVYGYRLVMGQAALTLGQVVPHFIKIGLVLAMVTSWPTYQRVVFDLMFAGPQEIAGAVMARSGNGSPDNVVTSLQALFDDMTDYAGDAWEQRGPAGTAPPGAAPGAAPKQPSPFTPDPATAAAMASNVPTNVAAGPPAGAAMPFALGPPQFTAMALWASALLMFATSIGLLLIVRIILAVLLMFGPVFIAMALFGVTRSLFEGWLRVTVKFALVPLIVLPLSAVLVAVLGRFVGELVPGPILAFRDTPALAILAIVVVFSAVLSQALSLTGMIAAAIRLPRRREVAAPAPDNSIATPPIAPVAQPSRAEAIASLVPIAAPAGSTGSSPRSGDLVASRLVEAPASRNVAPAEFENRLGQGFRRHPPRTGFAADIRTTGK